jgi:glycosyltransferase involved in cell wall biosynthesis
MRVAFFIKSTTHHSGYGGLETLNKNLCEGLAQRGHSVTVFSPKRDVKMNLLTESGVNYVFIESVYRTLFRAFNKNNWFNRSLDVFSEYHKKEAFDLVVSQSTAGLAIIQKKEMFGVKCIGISHGTIISEIRTRLDTPVNSRNFLQLVRDLGFTLSVFFGRQREYVYGCDRIVAVSNFVKTSLIDETYCPENKIIVIHNGSDFALRMESLKDEIKRNGHFLHVGRLTKEKGIDIFPKMFSDLKFTDYFLDIVGTGEYENELRNTVNKLNLENIKLHGKQAYDETAQWFAKSKVFLFPTKRIEGFPMVLVEAMFAGLPVVAFDMGGVSDAVIDGETGFLVKAGDFDTFKDRAFKLISNEALCAEMSKKAYDKAFSEFTLAKMLDSYENLFKEITL